MRLGKLDNDTLERCILKKFTHVRQEVLSLPMIGQDCASVDLGGDIAVLSCDPITSATRHIGTLSVHINCNDAAAAGAEPVGLLVTLLAPPTATLEEIETIANELAEAARNANVDILGGHTEVTDSVTRFVTNTTVLAKLPPNGKLPGMRPGDQIVMTKWAGLEGSAVIVSDFHDKLAVMGEDKLSRLRGLTKELSVVPEGCYAARHGAHAMHDITEGGVFGAVWEMAYTAGCGIRLNENAIPVLPETEELCRLLGLDPYRLLSSGAMLIACENGKEMAAGLQQAGVPAAVIGCAEAGTGVYREDGTVVHPPEADELYRLF
ncbi:MAG: AIR synthase family protein [Eubacteriales bacterium]|nr:AIR synthase family protein [Eubacteriales bacterium]